MKRNFLVLLLLVFTFLGCGKKVYDSDISVTSINYKGEFRGILPCADCLGIETSIVLRDDSKYVLTQKYLGKDNYEIKVEGTFSWEKGGKTIVLEYEKKTSWPNKYMVGENTLTALDAEGNKFTGNSADKYVLQMYFTRPKIVVDAPFAGSMFKIVEIDGIPVVQETYMLFGDSGRFTANTGCNNMVGDYAALLSNEVKFDNVTATKMACDNMDDERKFAKNLGLATQFTFDNGVLIFTKTDGTVLLRLVKR